MSSYDSRLMEYNPELEMLEQEQFEWGETEWGGEAESVLSEADEMELAAELLEVTSEEELDQFLGGLIKKVGGTVGKFVKSPVGKAIGGVLKGVAKKALPIAGGALGAYFGGPLGAKIGSGLASAAGGALGLELEALSQEDREFEGAKQFVRFAADTVKKATSAPPTVNPITAAQSAAAAAAKKYAPDLLRPNMGSSRPLSRSGRSRGGRWVRRGRNIIIVNV